MTSVDKITSGKIQVLSPQQGFKQETTAQRANHSTISPLLENYAIPASFSFFLTICGINTVAFRIILTQIINVEGEHGPFHRTVLVEFYFFNFQPTIYLMMMARFETLKLQLVFSGRSLALFVYFSFIQTSTHFYNK